MKYRSTRFKLRVLLMAYCSMLVFTNSYAQGTQINQYNIIPYPSSLTPATGSFVINKQTVLNTHTKGAGFQNEAAFLQQMIRNYLGAGALKQSATAKTNVINLKYDNSIPGDEAYSLQVNRNEILLSAKSSAGMFYAIETLRQLMPAVTENVGAKGTTIVVPAVQIQDQPAFEWRGMMLDVARHFFSTTYLKKFIDLMALYKLNKLHLHLTDDQGWRIEIKKYPKLTEESAWRTYNNNDSACMKLAKETNNPDLNPDKEHIIQKDGKTLYGGFYTQEQMKDVIRYASSRHVEIIPEIDMPGHMRSATFVYPELTCDKDAGTTYGFTHPICPCDENVMTFAKNVYGEIADLFPSKYIHIGGDEVNVSDWGKSEECKAFMTKNNIKSLDQLQSFFTRQMEAFYHSKNKTLIGWDEIIQGGVDSTAMVMYWRPWVNSSPMRAAKNNNKVIMTPDGPFYFDAFPDKSTLSTVYNYNPFSKEYKLDKNDEKYIVGVQANVWSEMIASEKRVDYMIMPRMSALAELGWTNKKMYESYLQRLDGQYDRLDRLHVNYRLPDLPDIADSQVFLDTTSFFVKSPSPRFAIRYTTDGSYPSASSPIMQKPVTINRSLTMKVAAFTAANRRGDVSSLVFDHQSYAKPVSVSGLQPGLICQFFKGSFDKTTAIKAVADSTMLLENITIPSSMPENGFGLKFRGYIDIPETGIYSFFLTSNDGSVLRIAGRTVVNNDGYHADKEKSGQVAVEKGLQPFELDFMDGGGGYALYLKYSNNNSKAETVPPSWFKSKK